MALRLACQWSPQQWTEWTPLEVYEHRIRVFVRSVLQAYLNPQSGPSSAALKRVARVVPAFAAPPNAHVVAQSLPDLKSHWDTLHDLEPTIDVATLTHLSESAEAIWNLLPGITVLQQLVQPLLEALILTDRVWKLRAAEGVDFVTLVRLFDPKQSPRCMALVASKGCR